LAGLWVAVKDGMLAERLGQLWAVSMAVRKVEKMAARKAAVTVGRWGWLVGMRAGLSALMAAA
jgi:hypothetical protein